MDLRLDRAPKAQTGAGLGPPGWGDGHVDRALLQQGADYSYPIHFRHSYVKALGHCDEPAYDGRSTKDCFLA